MGYAMNEYGRDLSPEERKEKALENAASWWGQWKWYELHAHLFKDYAYQKPLEENRNRYLGAKTILNFLLDMADTEIEAYCDEHTSWRNDDHALDIEMPFFIQTPWGEIIEK